MSDKTEHGSSSSNNRLHKVALRSGFKNRIDYRIRKVEIPKSMKLLSGKEGGV